LKRFLDTGPAPIYVGFGSMPDPAPERTTRLVVEAVRRVGMRLVLSSGWANLGGEALGDDVCVAGPVSHRHLFPHLRLVVHHGGAGTTAASARAGVPQVVVPHAFDQFVNGERVRTAGLGAVLPRKKLDVEALGRVLAEVLGNAAMSEAAKGVGARIRSRDSFAQAMKQLDAASAAHRP
jgi:vancomycin aglycone glucosyltransferase